MQVKFDIEKAKKNIEMIREKMHGDTDIFLLKKYHKLYRKEISFFKRSWAAAWLFMYYDQKETPPLRTVEIPVANKKSKANKKKKAAADNNSLSTDDIVLSDDESKKLFFSIGKNRRLYPREVISLIISKTTAVKGDIGVIRILENFSFLQVRDVKADEIIKTLNGIKFRGRKLTVNYAKPKNETSGEMNH
jgi:hypothetical protein